jgi:hypothetical protein
MTSREKGLTVLSKRLRFKDPKGLEETYDYFAKSFAMPTRISQEGLRNTLEIVAQRNPAAKVDLNMAKYLDESILDELDREGFFKRLLGKS